jgi:hypothetical protein
MQNRLLEPSHERRRVDLQHFRISAIREIRELQLAQTGPDRIELRLAVSVPLRDEHLAFLNGMMTKSFGTHFEWQIVYLDAIPKTPSGKLLQFVNALGAEHR